MKKSKIIVPALGILLLSTAASVSGTVAWFTANRTYDLDAGNFAVVSTKTNLSCTVAGGVGTAFDSENGAIKLDTAINSGNLKLTDASVDPYTKNLAAPDSTGDLLGKEVVLASAVSGATNASTENGLYRESVTETAVNYYVYSAFTWTMDFSITHSSVSQTVGLFFDNSKSEVTKTTKTGDVYDAVADTGKGFRLAFIPQNVETSANVTNGAGIAKVWAPNQTEANCHYIDLDGDPAHTVGTTTLASLQSDYSANALMCSADNTLDCPEDSEAGLAVSSAHNYMGTFTFTAGATVHLKYLVVAYFEGTDPTIVNNADTVYEEVRSHLNFGTAILAA